MIFLSKKKKAAHQRVITVKIPIYQKKILCGGGMMMSTRQMSERERKRKMSVWLAGGKC
jgi:hypothetical protein